MMPQRIRRCAVALAIVACALLPSAPAVAATPTRFPSDAGSARLVSSTQAGVTFEVAVPWEQLRVDSSGSHYVQVSMPGWSVTARAGAPMLPHMLQVIGVPLGATLSVRVQPGRVHMVALSAPVLPVATQKVKSGPPTAPEGTPALPEPSLVVEEDPSVYSGDAEVADIYGHAELQGPVSARRVK